MSIWTAITPMRKGGLVHATSLSDSQKTACNKPCLGWRVAIGHVSCRKCKAAIHLPVDPNAKQEADE